MKRGGVLRLPEKGTRNARGVSGPGYMPGPRGDDRRRANGPSSVVGNPGWLSMAPPQTRNKAVMAPVRQPLCVIGERVREPGS